MGLFGKDKPPKEMVKEWSTKIRQEQRQVDRQIRGIQREEEKVKKTLKQAAKKGDTAVCKILAKEIVRARKQVNKMHTTKAQMNSILLSMQQQQATIRVSGSLAKSTEVMKSMEKLIKVPQVMETMRELSKEMTKAGIIEEMIEDTMESVGEEDELEEEAQEEVDKVLWEITQGELGKAPTPGMDSLPVEPQAAMATVADDEEDVTEMQARLEALRS